MKMLLAAICMGMAVQAHGVFELNPECPKLYDMFNLPNLSYEDVGKIADKMHEKECWPVLQGLIELDTPSNTITDCASLAPHIVQMTKDQATESNPAIAKLYGVKALDQKTCGAQ